MGEVIPFEPPPTPDSKPPKPPHQENKGLN
jgi:hypothetical protein